MNIYKQIKLSNLNKEKQHNILNFTLNTNFEFRKKLDIDKTQKFGTEIEFIYPTKSVDILNNYIENNFSNWILEEEIHCYNGELSSDGMELSSDILNSNQCNLLELKTLFEYLQKDAKINLSCSNHIHYDINILRNKYIYYERFLKFFSVYEPIIYKFSCGELSFLRNCITRYCNEIGKDYYITLKDKNKRNIKYLKDKYNEKSKAIRFSKFNTIEIRTPMGTLNPYINQNYILFFYKIFEYIKSNRYNEELINNKFNNIINRKTIIEEYDNINIDDVFNLCDMLYQDTKDKIYFLKQTLKLYNNKDYSYCKII